MLPAMLMTDAHSPSLDSGTIPAASAASHKPLGAEDCTAYFMTPSVQTRPNTQSLPMYRTIHRPPESGFRPPIPKVTP